MLDITAKRSGSAVADVLRDIRGIPAGVIPYAAAVAMTRVAKIAATKDLPAEMRRVFDRPVRWTLNSVRVVPATKDTLSARIFVKDDAPRNGTRPEDYLLPQVEGGGRKEKRFERAMRYAGLLPAGWRAIPGDAAPLDGYGNLKRGEIQRILTATRTAFDPYQRKTNSKRSRRNARNAPYFGVRPFTGVITGGDKFSLKPSHITPGVYRRVGASIKPVLIFTKTQPTYRRRLDFSAVSERTTRQNFQVEFDRAATAILARNR
jgi:hypothetical protein